jgi:flagellar hook-associated protein 2
MAEGIPTINVIVKNNKESIKSNLDNFINKFNDSYKFIKDNYYSDKDGNRGIFVGNATAIGLMQQFSSTSYQQVSGLPDGNYSYLADIGITFDTSKGLSISDSDKLNTAMESNPDQVAALFNSDDGIANQLYNLVDSYTGTDGTISHLIDSYDTSVSYLKDKVTQRQTEIDKHAEILRNQYQKMQLQLSSLFDMQSNLSSMGLLG